MDTKSLVTVGIITLMLFLENILPFFGFKTSLVKRISFNFVIGGINTIIAALTTGVWMTYVLNNPWSNYLLQNIDANWLLYVASFLVLDFYIYLWHRFIMHSTSVGWALHKFHHEDITMNSSSAFRFHPLEVFISQIPRIGVVWLFGIPLQLFVLYELIFLVQNVIQHSNIGLPLKLDQLLSKFIITPNLHKVHHSTNSEETNSNYATILSIWDKLMKSRVYRGDFKDFKLGI